MIYNNNVFWKGVVITKLDNAFLRIITTWKVNSNKKKLCKIPYVLSIRCTSMSSTDYHFSIKHSLKYI